MKNKTMEMILIILVSAMSYMGILLAMVLKVVDLSFKDIACIGITLVVNFAAIYMYYNYIK